MSIKVFSKMELQSNATLTLDQANTFPLNPKLWTQVKVKKIIINLFDNFSLKSDI